MSVQWKSVDPRNGAVVAYSASDNAAIEASYQAKRENHQLVLGGMPFTICFSRLVQINQNGGCRKVMREVAGPSQAHAPNPTASATLLVPSGVYAMAISGIATIDQMCSQIEKNFASFHHKYNPSGQSLESFMKKNGPNSNEQAAVLHCLEQLITLFTNPQYNPGGSEGLYRSEYRPRNSQVPAYFANVKNEGPQVRKLRSLLGLRNLVDHGPSIFAELYEQLFESRRDAYGAHKGLNAMLFYTGNRVDLDTKLFDCTQDLDMINKMLPPGTRPFSSPSDLFTRGQQIVHDAARGYLKQFSDDLKLNSRAIAERRLELHPHEAVRTANGNEERGIAAVWGYNNVGVMSFHANVPVMADVIGAVLKAPYYLAKAYLSILDNAGAYGGRFDASQATRGIQDLFSEAVEDSCFNQKWKMIERFCDKLENSNDIFGVLDELQHKHQKEFTAIAATDSADRRNEKKRMMELVDGKGLRGRDPKTGTVRTICRADVEKWIEHTN